MSQPSNKPPLSIINPARVRYIKLGSGGSWERECLDQGIIRMGFGTESTERFFLCESRNWAGLVESFLSEGTDKGTASRSTNELRLFFEDDGNTLWITFMNERLYWGLVDSFPAVLHADGNGVWRAIKGGWVGTDINGDSLTKDKLSGALTKSAAYRGTSCDVSASKYVVRALMVNGCLMLRWRRQFSKECNHPFHR